MKRPLFLFVFFGAFLSQVAALKDSLPDRQTLSPVAAASGSSERPLRLPARGNTIDFREFGKVPIYFIPNAGQLDGRVDFYVQGKEKHVYFTAEGVTYALGHRAELDVSDGYSGRWAVTMDFVGARKGVKPEGQDETGAVISYFKGKPENWKAGLAAYSKIIYRDLWPGIDLVYKGDLDKLKYEFIVHPGADPQMIRIAIRGAEG